MTDGETQPWGRLVELLQSLPEENQHYFEERIGSFVHDVKQSISITYSAQALLRRSSHLSPADIELLDMIQNACQRSLDLLANFAKQFDQEGKDR